MPHAAPGTPSAGIPNVPCTIAQLSTTLATLAPIISTIGQNASPPARSTAVTCMSQNMVIRPAAEILRYSVAGPTCGPVAPIRTLSSFAQMKSGAPSRSANRPSSKKLCSVFALARR